MVSDTTPALIEKSRNTTPTEAEVSIKSGYKSVPTTCRAADGSNSPQWICRTSSMASNIQPSYKQNFWKRRTSLEKCLILITFLFLILSILAVIAVVTWTRNHAALKQITKQDSDVCMTPHCVRAAARILDAMDQNIKPCDDFFEYACGAWNRKNIIPDDKSNYNTFRKLGDELQASLKGMFESQVMFKELKATRNVKDLYQSCIDIKLIEDRKEEPLIQLINDLGGWPVLDQGWNEQKFDFEKVLAKLRLLSNRALINQWVAADDRDSNVHIIMIDQPLLGMPSRDYFLKGRDDKVLQTYEDFAISVAVALGASPANAKREMGELIDFEIELANITTPEEERRDTSLMYRRYAVKDLYKNITNEIDWQKFLSLVFGEAGIQLKENQEEQVVVYAEEYLKKLGLLLRKTPKRITANYLVWYIVMSRIGNLNQRFLDLRRNINKALLGTDQDEPRWSQCVSYVNENLGMAVGRVFVSQRFDETAKANAMEMIESIRESFTELLEEVPWMDDETKRAAKEKAEYIQERIGYPDYIMNDTALNEEYAGIDIDSTKYFENVLALQKAAARRNCKYLRLAVDRSRWTAAPAIVNAFYSASKNQIMFPAGILQPPFYHKAHPKSLNFGGIGMIIGHELTHAFDDRGRQYNKDGNLKEWWSDSVIEKFKAKAQCIIDQYSNYTVVEAGLNVNGIQTQGENIADNGGLKQAFRAYQRWSRRNNVTEQLLPGLPHTHEQLFFLNFAQIWCGTTRPESAIKYVRVGRHSPGRFRVIGPLSNSYEFAKAYDCPAGTDMNPINKCAVW